MAQPRILLYDIETAPALVYTWSNYDTNVIATKEDWYMLSFAYKWLGEDEIHFERKSSRRGDDKALVKKLWKLFDEADIVVAHNGDKFDKKKANARFIETGLGPPSPYQTIDTNKAIKRVSANYSNSLDEIARRNNLGRKLKHQGIQLWLDCMADDEDAWATMEAYNRHDVDLLEKAYFLLRPWIDSVNLSHWSDRPACRHCGSLRLHSRGTHPPKNKLDVTRTNASVWRVWLCLDCEGWTREKHRMSEASMR